VSDGTALTVPPAGWYPDRNEANVVRWWDGQQWTDQTQSTAPAAAAFEQPVSAAAFGFVPPEQNPVAQNPAAQSAVAQSPLAQAPAAQTPIAQAAAAQTAAAQTPIAQTPAIPPGWYPDNRDPSLQRWWDGQQWTTHTAPAVSQAQPYAAAGLVSSPNNTMATLSLALSIGSFAGLLVVWLLPLALAGIIVGIVALRRAARFEPSRRRRGQAIAGIIVGAVSLIMTILLTVSALLVYEQVHRTDVSQTGTQQSSPQTGSGSAADTGTPPLPATLVELKQVIANSVERQESVAVSKVTCDAEASMVAGSTFECGADVSNGRWSPVRVTILNATGVGMSYSMGLGGLLPRGSVPQPDDSTVAQIVDELTTDLATAWGNPVSGVRCDPAASTSVGSQFQCAVDLEAGDVGRVTITMVAVGGYDVTVAQLPGTSTGSGSGGSIDPNPDLSNS
jgi:uncharacterized protein DUF2510/uncharacterized protein DUF4190/uncharacterized protein DUF4333